jgi:hypothetical protein
LNANGMALAGALADGLSATGIQQLFATLLGKTANSLNSTTKFVVMVFTEIQVFFTALPGSVLALWRRVTARRPWDPTSNADTLAIEHVCTTSSTSVAHFFSIHSASIPIPSRRQSGRDHTGVTSTIYNDECKLKGVRNNIIDGVCRVPIHGPHRTQSSSPTRPSPTRCPVSMCPLRRRFTPVCC